MWACLRLRADLISTFPCDTFRSVQGAGLDLNVSVPKPPVLVTPGGDAWDYVEWMWASQHDFDKSGNIIGVITEWDGRNMPARIDLAPASATTVIQRKGDPVPLYKIDNTEYRGRWSGPNSAGKIWHERQYPVPGIPVGLSPLAYAAWSIGEALSLQDFALDWFGGGPCPRRG